MAEERRIAVRAASLPPAADTMVRPLSARHGRDCPYLLLLAPRFLGPLLADLCFPRGWPQDR
jgi:hypothetical protein